MIEGGWSESLPRLRLDKDLWIHGCGANMKLVILTKWSSLVGGKVSGLIEVWEEESQHKDDGKKSSLCEKCRLIKICIQAM